MKIKSKKLIIFSAIAILLVAGGAYAYSRNSNDANLGTTSVSTEKGQINYDPPTEEEQKAGDNVKEKLDGNSEPETNDDDSIKSVKPEITYSGVYEGNVEVNSYVPGIFENSGKCTLTLKKDGKTVSQSKTAVPNVSEMSCGVIKVPVSKLSSGTWSATVTYSSSKAKGSSGEVFIEVK